MTHRQLPHLVKHGRFVLLVMIAAACRKEASTPPREPRLFTEDEIAAYEAQLTTRLAETAKRTCVRPVVREPGTDTAATTDLIALAEPTGPLATCLKTFSDLATAPGMTTAKLVEARDPKVLALDATCGDELEQVVRKAAVHRNACSPYQIGVRKDPDSFMSVMASAHLLAQHGRLSAERGTPAFALGMLLDGASAYRDLGRGRVGLIAAMIAAATTNIVLEEARAIATTAKLAPADLDPLVAGVDALLASEPPFAEALLGERDYFALYFGMPPLKGKSWIPPGGGWPEGMGARAGSADAEGPYGTKPMTKSPRDEGGIMFAAAEQMAGDRDKACPVTANLKTCHDGLIALADTASKIKAKEVGETMWTDLVKAAGSGDAIATAHRIREAIVSILANVAHPAFSKYAGKRADGYARLAAFRIHLEVLRAGHCPTDAELAAPPYSALLVPTALGDALTVTRLEGGDLQVSPPGWVDTKKSPWRISCKLR